MRVPADAAVGEYALRLRTVAGQYLDPVDMFEFGAEHRLHQVADAEGRIDEALDRPGALSGRDDIGGLGVGVEARQGRGPQRVLPCRDTGIDGNIDQETGLLFRDAAFLHQLDDAARRGLARVPRPAPRPPPHRPPVNLTSTPE